MSDIKRYLTDPPFTQLAEEMAEAAKRHGLTPEDLQEALPFARELLAFMRSLA